MNQKHRVKNQDSVPTALLYVDLVKTHEFLSVSFAHLFREHGLTQPMYNISRALYFRGGTDGLPIKDLKKYLINRVPDLTRLVDKMEQSGLVQRIHDKKDRRIVRVKITKKGEILLSRLDEPVLRLHNTQLGHLSLKEIKTIQKYLQKMILVPNNERVGESYITP